MNFRKSEMSAMEIDDQPLVDPFLIINEELHDLIYQHFTGKEVIDLSTVSKQWKFNIGVSPAAMKKIKLVYNLLSHGPASKDVTAILASEHRYSNVSLFNVQIPRTTRNQQLQVVKKIAPWVKNLEVAYSEIGDIDLKFPRVEKLILNWSRINQPILDGVTPSKLKMLKINLIENMQIKAFLMKCIKLEELSVKDEFPKSIFETEAAFPFKLKTFEFISSYLSMKPNIISYFEKFIFSQSSSLQCLILRRCNMDFAEAALKSLPLLKELKLYDPTSLVARQSSVNTSVEDLTLIDTPDSVLELLAALPNLKTLKLEWIFDNTEIDRIASTAMNLRGVKFKRSRINVQDYYATFRQNNPNVNQNIEWIKSDYNDHRIM